ncbi:hypothetical protein D3C84_594740 [compost metagenome]
MKEEKKDGPTWIPIPYTKRIKPKSRTKCNILSSTRYPKCPKKSPTNITAETPSEILPKRILPAKKPTLIAIKSTIRD